MEAAAERIERELSKDLFGDTAMGSPADNGLGVLDVESFDPLMEAVSAKWDTFSVNGDPARDGEGSRVVPMSPIRTPPHKELSPTGKDLCECVPQCQGNQSLNLGA